MKTFKFSDLVDVSRLQILMESFYSATGIPSGIVDVDGNILVAVGWYDICTKFYRNNPETNLLCMQSDKYIGAHLHEITEEEPYIWYKCANGLIDAAAPIIIDGVHLATIMQGQILFKKPDIEKFRCHARKYGFDEAEYLKALDRVRILTKDELDSIMKYFLQLGHLLGEIGLAKMRLLESQAMALEDSEKKLKAIIDNTPNVAIRSYDLQGKPLFWNRPAEKLFGKASMEIIEEPMNMQNPDNTGGREFLEILKAAEEKNNSVGPLEWTISDGEGQKKTFYSTVFPFSFAKGNKEFICIDVDVTERKQFEKEMARLEQLNLIGEMAASIGHEVRNPMTTVRGYLQILGDRSDCDKYKDQFELMIEELDRANSIITEFLSLAKNKAIKLEKKNLNSIIKALTPLIDANAIIQNVTVNIVPGKISDVLLDEKEIRQLILNLVRNGLEAMTATSGGSLTIKTLQKNNEVILVVQDQGHGIPFDLIDKIGTPFFSTKDYGTGMGLAVCYSIAARHEAKITVDSGADGTVFSVRFKAC